MFHVNIGYAFELDSAIQADSAVVLCGAMPMHQLERRKLKQYPHMKHLLFDPQLYLAEIECGSSKGRKHCAKLASYPWFGVTGLPTYDSANQKQHHWMTEAVEKISKIWPGKAPTDPEAVALGARECVDFQIRKGTRAIIVPSPLTVDFASDYAAELQWVDDALAHVKALGGVEVPVFASVVISDLALKFHEPEHNPLLATVLDQLTAREVQGVYIVIEQSSEPSDTRHCASPKTLRSLLYLVHQFSREAQLQVGINFQGAFGLVCEAAGATWWASNWYKSLRRFRLLDANAEGRTRPWYWSAPSCLDINMESDFDLLAAAGLQRIADETPSCVELLLAAKQGKASKTVLDWEYRVNNRTAPIAHYLHSAIKMETALEAHPDGAPRLEHVETWLASAAATAAWASPKLGPSARTSPSHVQEWLEAFRSYRLNHEV